MPRLPSSSWPTATSSPARTRRPSRSAPQAFDLSTSRGVSVASAELYAEPSVSAVRVPGAGECVPDAAALSPLGSLLTGTGEVTPAGQSCSAGLAAWDGVESADDLLGRADDALYEAKQTGRDRTVVA